MKIRPLKYTFSGEQLKNFREAQNFSQAELSRFTGITQPTISKLEAGSYEDISGRQLIALCRVLRVNAHDLYQSAYQITNKGNKNAE